jgi:ATP-dependent RNA/DNA helicase IGHMBP2
MDYFKKLQDLLKTERLEDRQQYIKQTESSSLAEKRMNGWAWFPVAIRGSEMTRGEYINVELERTTHHDVSHQFRNGMPAVFFTNHDAKNDRIEGTISYQNGNKLKITLKTDELPEWSRDGKLGVELLFDDNSYDVMQDALKAASEIAEKSQLIQILTGEKKPSQNTIPWQNVNQKTAVKLNESQLKSVDNILTTNELAIIHGPPGTGKTTTIVQAIKALVEQKNEKILVVAPSNTAVDLLSEKLNKEGLRVLRVGNPARVSEELQALTLDAQMANHDRLKETKRLKKQAQEFKNMAHKYKRSFGRAEGEQRKALFAEAHKIMKEVENTEQYIIEDLMAKTQVVTATLVGSNHYTVRQMQYDTVVIDEAGQAIEPACWVAILKAKKVILAGDHCQLPPTIKSADAARNGLAKTLMERCIALHPEVVTLLEEQYRMNESIMGYSSAVFYESKLKAHHSVAKNCLFEGDLPLLFVDTAGCGFEEKLEGTSSTNPEEAALLFKHLSLLAEELKGHFTKENFPTVAVISPYKQQIGLLKEQLEHSPALKEFQDKIAINTIDSFQGQERDIVYISLVRSNDKAEIGFLADIRRMNVAMTRAKKKLVVVGDSATLAQHTFYADFIDYAQNINGYLSAWELMG